MTEKIRTRPPYFQSIAISHSDRILRSAGRSLSRRSGQYAVCLISLTSSSPSLLPTGFRPAAATVAGLLCPPRPRAFRCPSACRALRRIWLHCGAISGSGEYPAYRRSRGVSSPGLLSLPSPCPARHPRLSLGSAGAVLHNRLIIGHCSPRRNRTVRASRPVVDDGCPERNLRTAGPAACLSGAGRLSPSLLTQSHPSASLAVAAPLPRSSPCHSRTVRGFVQSRMTAVFPERTTLSAGIRQSIPGRGSFHATSQPLRYGRGPYRSCGIARNFLHLSTNSNERYL